MKRELRRWRMVSPMEIGRTPSSIFFKVMSAVPFRHEETSVGHYDSHETVAEGSKCDREVVITVGGGEREHLLEMRGGEAVNPTPHSSAKTFDGGCDFVWGERDELR